MTYSPPPPPLIKHDNDNVILQKIKWRSCNIRPTCQGHSWWDVFKILIGLEIWMEAVVFSFYELSTSGFLSRYSYIFDGIIFENPILYKQFMYQIITKDRLTRQWQGIVREWLAKGDGVQKRGAMKTESVAAMN